MAFQGLGAIGQIHVSGTDVDRSVEFYRDVLGIPFLFRVEGRSMAFFDCGRVRLYLGAPKTEAYRSRAMIYSPCPTSMRRSRPSANAGKPDVQSAG